MEYDNEKVSKEQKSVTKMVKILHISKYYYPFTGGTEKVARDCINALIGAYEQKVICFNHEPGDKIDFIDDIEVIRCGCFTKIASQSLSITLRKQLTCVFKDFEPNYVIFHYPNPFVAHLLLNSIPNNCRLILYWHLDIVRQKVLGTFFNTQNIKLLESADKVIATSPNYIEGSKYLSIYKEKCTVIPNCIDEEGLEVTDVIIKHSEQIRSNNQDKIICLAVGRLVEYKGFEYLIRASKFLDDRFRIFIIGQGPLKDKLTRLATDDKKVRLLGKVDFSVLRAYLHASDIFCFPSITKNEAFGIALAEGMYFGKPSVTFTILGSGVNYVSLNDESGIECPNGDCKAFAAAMKKLADNIELRKQYGVAARQRVLENFTFDSFKKNVKNLLEETDASNSYL